MSKKYTNVCRACAGLFTGNHEYSDCHFNFEEGCEKDCLYCVIEEIAWNMRGVRINNSNPRRIKDPEVKYHINKGKRKNKDLILNMCSAHDISTRNADKYIAYILKYLNKGFKVIMTSKLSLEFAERLNKEIPTHFRNNFMVMITITSLSDTIGLFWEPKAPLESNRISALKYLYEHGFLTSVSISPILTNYIVALVNTVLPYISNPGIIILGIMDRFEHAKFVYEYDEDTLNELISIFEGFDNIYFKSCVADVLKVPRLNKIINPWKINKPNPIIKEENILKYNVGVKQFIKYGTQMDSSNVYYIARFNDGKCYGLCLNNHDDNKLAHINGHFRYVNPDNYDPFVAKELPIANSQPAGHYPRLMLNPRTEQVHRVEQISPNNFNSIIVAPIKDDDIETANLVDINTLVDFNEHKVTIR